VPSVVLPVGLHRRSRLPRVGAGIRSKPLSSTTQRGSAPTPRDGPDDDCPTSHGITHVRQLSMTTEPSAWPWNGPGANLGIEKRGLWSVETAGGLEWGASGATAGSRLDGPFLQKAALVDPGHRQDRMDSGDARWGTGPWGLLLRSTPVQLASASLALQAPRPIRLVLNGRAWVRCGFRSSRVLNPNGAV